MLELRLFHRLAFQPPQPFEPGFFGNRSAFEILPRRIDQPEPWSLAEFRAKPESVLSMLQTHGFVRSFGKRKLWLRSGPFLIRQFRHLQPYGIVEPCEKAMRVLNLIDRRALVRDQPLAIYEKLVLLGLSTENGVVLENQALHAWTGLAPEEQSRGKPADPATDDHAIVAFPGINDVLGKWLVEAVADCVARIENVQSVAVRGAVFANATVACKFILGSKQVCWSRTSEQHGSRR